MKYILKCKIPPQSMNRSSTQPTDLEEHPIITSIIIIMSICIYIMEQVPLLIPMSTSLHTTQNCNQILHTPWNVLERLSVSSCRERDLSSLVWRYRFFSVGLIVAGWEFHHNIIKILQCGKISVSIYLFNLPSSPSFSFSSPTHFPPNANSSTTLSILFSLSLFLPFKTLGLDICPRKQSE